MRIALSVGDGQLDDAAAFQFRGEWVLRIDDRLACIPSHGAHLGELGLVLGGDGEDVAACGTGALLQGLELAEVGLQVGHQDPR